MFLWRNSLWHTLLCTEIDWLSRVYDIEACTIWKEEALEEQEKVSYIVMEFMHVHITTLHLLVHFQMHIIMQVCM